RVRLRAARHVAVARNDHEQAPPTVHAATRSTSCSRRASNAGQVHSAATYALPAVPSSSRRASRRASASANSSRAYANPPFARLAEIDDERSARRVALAEGRRVVPRRRVEPDAEHLAWDVLVVEARTHQSLLFDREETERPWKLEQRAVRQQLQRLFVVGG